MILYSGMVYKPWSNAPVAHCLHTEGQNTLFVCRTLRVGSRVGSAATGLVVGTRTTMAVNAQDNRK